MPERLFYHAFWSKRCILISSAVKVAMSIPNAALQKVTQPHTWVVIQSLTCDSSCKKLKYKRYNHNKRLRRHKPRSMGANEKHDWISSHQANSVLYRRITLYTKALARCEFNHYFREYFWHRFRFVAVPINTLNTRLSTESASLKKEIGELEKKLHYQETTFKNSRQHIEKILQSGAR